MKVVNTDFANDLVTAGDRARYDNAAKILLSNKDIVANILKNCTAEFHNYDKDFIKNKCIMDNSIKVKSEPVNQDEPDDGPERIAGLNNEDVTLTEGAVRFDILFEARVPDDGRRKRGRRKNPNTESTAAVSADGSSSDSRIPKSVALVINLEIQQDVTPGYQLEKRAVYYCSRLISNQKRGIRKFNFKRIKKVYSIWICLSTDNFTTNSLSRYTFCPTEVYQEKFSMEDNAYVDKSADCLAKIMQKNAMDLMEIIFIHIADAETDSAVPIIKMLSNTFSRKKTIDDRREILQNEFGVAMTKEIEEGVREMCTFGEALERAEARAEEKARAARAEAKAARDEAKTARDEAKTARDEARTAKDEARTARDEAKAARAEIERNRLEAIKSIMSNFKVTIDRAMAVAGVPDDELEEYRKKLALA